MKEQFQAVYKNDVNNFFDNLGLLGNLCNGDLKCYHCDSTLTLDNFRAITKYKGNILFACNNEECVMALANLIERY